MGFTCHISTRPQTFHRVIFLRRTERYEEVL
jgi:hypothetical protein